MQTVNTNAIRHIVEDLDALEQESRSRETSQEVLVAIAERAADRDEFESIWANGTDDEAIVARAWELADEDEETLYWGGPINR